MKLRCLYALVGDTWPSNGYNAFEGIIMALYFRYDNAVDSINIEWGISRIIAERFMSVNKFGACAS